MERLPFLTRRGFIASSMGAVTALSLAQGAQAAARPEQGPIISGATPGPLAVLVTLPGAERLIAELRARGLRAEPGSAEAMLLDPAASARLGGRRLVHLGSAADQVLIGLALDSHGRTRLIERGDHRTAGTGSVHGLETFAVAAACPRTLGQDLAAAGFACRVRGTADASGSAALAAPAGQRHDSWQSATLAHVLARAGGPAPALRWDDAPDAFSTLIADL